MTWDRWLYFPSEGRRAEDFFALKNPTASAGFEPANLGTKGQHATPRPLKPLSEVLKCMIRKMHKNCLQNFVQYKYLLFLVYWLSKVFVT
jgi:hypothetical protein